MATKNWVSAVRAYAVFIYWNRICISTKGTISVAVLGVKGSTKVLHQTVLVTMYPVLKQDVQLCLNNL